MDADDYLAIPDDYARALGGLRWSPEFDAIEFSSDFTLTVVQQLEQVLEGLFGATADVPHFAHVLHLLALVLVAGHRTPDGDTSLGGLNAAYGRARGPGESRNLGVLMAALCRSLPRVAAPPVFGQVRLGLKRRLLFRDPSDPRRAEKPALGPAEFERRIRDILSEYDIDTLAHWLRHGCASKPAAGRRLAEVLIEPPSRKESFTAALRRRPRLAGAVALVTTLEAALALPPRRLRPDARPEGGYAGVTTRGDPERLLLSQFALEPQDFVRRFAEHELLYYRREEPHRRERPTRLLVFDQGVRTWGGVRLALAGAVIALMGKDRRRHGAPLLALTAAARPPFDPADLPVEELAGLLEASDLSPHPAACFSGALAEPHDGQRDVVLLTHPRNRRESAVIDAAASLRPADRLFALTVDGDGRAELAEWRRRGFVELRTFRVDLAGAMAVYPTGPEAPRAPAGAIAPWTGDVEPIAYPFRPGLLDTPQRLAFDATGDWLAVAGPDGLLQVARIGATAAEVLPRAFKDGVPLTDVDALLGVAGGFVVGGRMKVNLPAQPQQPGSTEMASEHMGMGFVLAHYNVTRRTARLYAINLMLEPMAEWLAFPDLHAVVVRGKGFGWTIDLATGDRYARDGSEKRHRAQEAWDRARGLWWLQPPSIPVFRPTVDNPEIQGPWVKELGGSISFGGVQPRWPPFVPTSDGRPLLDTGRLGYVAQLGGQTMALRTRPERGRPKLLLIHGPGGRLIREFEMENADRLSELSLDGRLLARQIRVRAIEVVETTDGTRPVLTLVRAAVHPDLRVRLDERSLAIAVGKFVHWFELTAPLRYRRLEGGPHDVVPRSVIDAGASTPVRCEVVSDPQRFQIAASRGRTTAILDRWGQVILFRSGRVVAYFLVRRGLAAVCLPDGTRWGSYALLGGPETPGAADAVGRALQSIDPE
jgi:hypothetical protein